MDFDKRNHCVPTGTFGGQAIRSYNTQGQGNRKWLAKYPAGQPANQS